MRTSPLLLSAVVAAGCHQDHPTTADHNAHGHAHGTAGHNHGAGGHDGHAPTHARLDIRTDGSIQAGTPATLRLSITGASGQPVKAFVESHEAKVHLIVVRAGLDQFAHLHPEVNGETGELTSRHTFPAGGAYHLFADFHEPGRPAGVAVGKLQVAGDAPPAPALTPDVPGVVTGDGLTARVSVEGVRAGGEGTIRFALAGPDGQPVADLQPYMGAMGHLVVISADAGQYVHAHPTDGPAGSKSAVAFAAQFPQAGVYKGWGQFKRGGRVQVVPFVLRAE
jgi:hypothetical protein